eukprot:Nitzschia sp. Nitz4//scaffold49_size126201//55785//59297//NITZ4_003641-RA/size126201-snap-gene-0.65-mRNA-1//-1//CDS//3329553146//7013//frame0
MLHRWWSWCLLYSVSQAVASLGHGLVDWLRTRDGGYWNEKQEIRRANPDDPNSMLGVFAVERIEKGEILCHVPWDSVISAFDEESGLDYQGKNNLSCQTVKNLLQEIERGDQSRVAPYVSYLLSQSYHQLPSTWSKRGKAFLAEVLGGSNSTERVPPLDPFSWYNDWGQECDGSYDDEFELQIAMLVVQRADEDVLIPLYDLYNHHNGNLNTQAVRVHGSYHETTAAKVIEAGEQIFNSYNLCHQCSTRHFNFGTPEILRDYGFVEFYPQRFYFFGETGARLDLDRDSNGEVVASYNRKLVPESREWRLMYNFMKEEMHRLATVKNRVTRIQPEETLDSIPERELFTVWAYHNALTTAMEKGLELLGAGSGNATWAPQPQFPYHALDEEPPAFKVTTRNCENIDLFFDNGYKVIDTLVTGPNVYNVETNGIDTCLHTNGHLSVCESYRPHYYETLVQKAVPFLKEIRSVLVLGSGNPMVLQEVLRLDEVENLVFLAADQPLIQFVGRHFQLDSRMVLDDRVTWIFGDHDVSLSFLQETSASKFDLIIADIPRIEDPMLINLLMQLSPTGIIASNTLDAMAMAGVCNYATQSYYQAPVVCSIRTSMASDGVDFATIKPIHRDIPSFEFDSSQWLEHGVESMHDYVRIGQAGRSCSSRERPNRDSSFTVIQTCESIQQETQSLDDRLEELNTIATENGYHPLGNVTLGKDPQVAEVILEEGSITETCCSERNTCTVRFLMHQSTQLPLSTPPLNWKDSFVHVPREFSNARLLPFPASDERVDRMLLQNEKSGDHVQRIMGSTVESCLELFPPEKDTSIVVLCSTNVSECSILAATEPSRMGFNTVVLSRQPLGSDIESMLEYETEILKDLRDAGDVGLVLVDESVPSEMLQVLDSIWSSERNRLAHFADDCVLLHLGESDTLKTRINQNFMTRIRASQRLDPVQQGRFQLVPPEHLAATVELGIVDMFNEDRDLSTFFDLEQRLGRRLSDWRVQLQSVLGGVQEYDSDFYATVASIPHSYLETQKMEQVTGESNVSCAQSMFRLRWIDMSSQPSTPETLFSFAAPGSLQSQNLYDTNLLVSGSVSTGGSSSASFRATWSTQEPFLDVFLSYSKRNKHASTDFVASFLAALQQGATVPSFEVDWRVDFEV